MLDDLLSRALSQMGGEPSSPRSQPTSDPGVPEDCLRRVPDEVISTLL